MNWVENENPNLGNCLNRAFFKFVMRSLLFFLLICLPTFAQQRPLLTEDPRLIATGSLVTEAGFGYFNRAHFPLSGLTGDQFTIFDNGFNFGLGPHAEFQVNGAFHNFLHVRDGGTGWRNDWGNFSLSTKIKIVDETPVLPIISFRPTVVLPNSADSRGIGTDSTNVFGSVLVGKNAGPLFLFGNAGIGILTDTIHIRAQQDVLTYGIAGVLPLNQRISLLSEWNGMKNPRNEPSPGTESRSQARFGFQFRAGGLRWDAAASKGLTDLDPRFGVVFGLTKEFQLWK